MRNDWLVFVATVAVALAGTGTYAASTKGYQLYPLPAVVVSSETITEQGMVRNDLISKEWDALQKKNLEIFNKKFVTVVNESFPELAVEKIVKADRDRSLVVSFHIARARHYSVAKPNGTQDFYVPITGTLYFTNPRTTEVVLALSSTVKPIQTLSASDGELNARLESLYLTAFDALLDDLILQAKGRFSPSEIPTIISQVQYGLGITSVGTRAGLSSGDQLVSPSDGVPLKLISCDERSCVGKRSVGEVSAGAMYVKLSSGKLSAFEKPTVYVLVKTKNTPALDPVWAQIFAENLGENSPFNVVFFNPAFDYVITTVSRVNEISREDIERRDPPELVLEISVDEPLGYKLPTNLSYKFATGFVGRATAKVVDRSGNVIFSASSLDLVEDQVTEGIDFSPEDRAEISVKNVLIALAERVTKEFKPAELAFTIKQAGDRFVTDDPGRLLRPGKEYTVYRSIKLSSDGSALRLPIGYLKGSRSTGPERELSKTPKVITPKKVDVATGDVIVVRNAVSKALNGDNALSLCGPAENRGQVELPNVHEKIFSALSRTVNYPFVDDKVLSAVDFMFSGKSGFVETEIKSAADEASQQFCIQPIQKIEPAEKTCKNNICQILLSVQLGAALVKRGSSIVVKGIGQNVTTQGFSQSATDEEQRRLTLATAEQALDSAVVALAELVKPAFEAAILQQSSNQ